MNVTKASPGKALSECRFADCEAALCSGAGDEGVHTVKPGEIASDKVLNHSFIAREILVSGKVGEAARIAGIECLSGTGPHCAVILPGEGILRTEANYFVSDSEQMRLESGPSRLDHSHELRIVHQQRIPQARLLVLLVASGLASLRRRTQECIIGLDSA